MAQAVQARVGPPAGGATRLRRKPGAPGAAAERRAGLILVAPAVLIYAVFMFAPLLLTGWYSLHRYGGFGDLQWIGARNYTDLIGDPIFWRALSNTAGYTAVTVPLGIGLGFGAAVLLNRAMPARGLFRALVYVPVVVSGVCAGIVFLRLFDPLRGVINQLLTGVGLPTVDWQGDGRAALVSVIVVTVWQGIGLAMVVYLAGIQSISGELYEAAQLDGAGPGQRLRHITWPLLAPTTFLLVVYSIITSFQVFDVVYVLTRGGPGNSTTFLVQYAYDEGFNQGRQGYAAAIGVVIYAFVLVLTIVQWRLSRRREAT